MGTMGLAGWKEQSQPLTSGEGEGLEVELITNGRWFNHYANVIKPP